MCRSVDEGFDQIVIIAVRRFFDEGIGFRGMRKLDRRPRSNFEFVREGQFQKEAEIARIRVSTVIANLCCFLACCIYLGSREEQAGSKAKSLLVACSKSLEMRG